MELSLVCMRCSVLIYEFSGTYTLRLNWFYIWYTENRVVISTWLSFHWQHRRLSSFWPPLMPPIMIMASIWFPSVITGISTGCHDDNHQCSMWQQSWHHENSRFSLHDEEILQSHIYMLSSVLNQTCRVTPAQFQIYMISMWDVMILAGGIVDVFTTSWQASRYQGSAICMWLSGPQKYKSVHGVHMWYTIKPPV